MQDEVANAGIAAVVLRQKSWIDLALDMVLSEKLTSRKQMNKREAKKRWKIFSTKIAGNYFPMEKVFHRADEFSHNHFFVCIFNHFLRLKIVLKCPKKYRINCTFTEQDEIGQINASHRHDEHHHPIRFF